MNKPKVSNTRDLLNHNAGKGSKPRFILNDNYRANFDSIFDAAGLGKRFGLFEYIGPGKSKKVYK